MVNKKINGELTYTLLKSHSLWTSFEISSLRENLCPEERIIYDSTRGYKILIPGRYTIDKIGPMVPKERDFLLKVVRG